MRIIFLGCSGGRRITFTQKRASGGFLIESENTKVHVDPGPGAFIRLIQVGVDPASIDGIVLSHRHLDHSADVNTLIEARTMGGWNPGGVVVAPEDAINGDDPVIFRYHRRQLERIEVLKEGSCHVIGSVTVKGALKHTHHGVETYGLLVETSGVRVGYVTDAKYQKGMGEAYKGCNVLIINTTFKNPRNLDHLSLHDAVEILKEAEPELGVITHFGAEVVFWGLDRAAKWVQKQSGIPVLAAREFRFLDLSTLFMEKLKLKNPIGIQ